MAPIPSRTKVEGSGTCAPSSGRRFYMSNILTTTAVMSSALRFVLSKVTCRTKQRLQRSERRTFLAFRARLRVHVPRPNISVVGALCFFSTIGQEHENITRCKGLSSGRKAQWCAIQCPAECSSIRVLERRHPHGQGIPGDRRRRKSKSVLGIQAAKKKCHEVSRMARRKQPIRMREKIARISMKFGQCGR